MTSSRALAASPVATALATWLAAGHVGPDAPLVVACSGGADSLALAAALAAVAPARARAAAVVDHGLQDGSAAVARRAADQLTGLGYRDARVLPVTVDGEGGMEAAARRARYAALDILAAELGPGSAVLLAHTADDQAETVLLGLSRGSGPRSIAGMGPWRAPWGRPLLRVRRAETEALCAMAGLSPWRDPHNVDPAFRRVRLRREVLPLLDDVLGGGVVPALARTAELMADDLAALDAWAAAVLAAAVGPDGELAAAPLAQMPKAVRTRVLRAWIAESAGVRDLTFEHLTRLEGNVMDSRTGRAVRLPTGVDVIRTRAGLRLARGDGRLEG